MKKRIYSILFVSLILSLAGCKEENRAETKTEAAVQNGERVTRKLTEKAVLDAVIELPKDWDGTVQSCRVRHVNFNGKGLPEKLYPDIPAEEWKNANVGGSDETEAIYYEGDIWIEEGQKPEPGMIYLATEFRINTARVERNRRLFQQNIRPDSYMPETDEGEERSFMKMEEAKKRAEQYWTEVIGLE